MAARISIPLVLLLFVGIVEGLKCSSRYSPTLRGYYMDATDCPGATLRNLTIENPEIICCILDPAIVPAVSGHVNISREVYLRMAGDTTRARAIYPFYMQALREADIVSEQEIADFTAQVLFQTWGMKFSEEKSSGAEYEGKENLGNIIESYGRKYISRGFLPLIGRHMYQLAASAVSNGLILSEPERVAFPSVGFKVAAWLWRNGYSSADGSTTLSGDLGKFCNGTEYSFMRLSYSIQQNTEGIEKLFEYWRHTLKVLGAPCPTEGNGSKCSSADGKQGVCKLAAACKGEYIEQGCPGPSPAIICCLDCQNPIDLAFVVDSSGSVKVENFRLGLQFITKVCDYFDISYSHGTRVALIRYSQRPKIMFHFNTYSRKRDVLNAISNVAYIAGGTHTDLALQMAYENFFSNSSFGVRPKDLGIPRVLVLLTDGKTMKGTQTVIAPSNLLRQDGVNIFVIGIGSKLNKDELNIIASDPDTDHVICPKTFQEVDTFVRKMQEATCYEPALLEEEEEVMSTVQQTAMKYYKYDLYNKTNIKTMFLKNTDGKTDISVSLDEKNPRRRQLNLGVCEESLTFIGNSGGSSTNHSNLIWQLEDLENSDFCDVNPSGGLTEPLLVSKDVFFEEGIVAYVRTCSKRWLYMSVEGINTSSTFQLTLFKELLRVRSLEDKTENIQENDTYTFPISKEVYAGAAVATVATTATVAAVVSLSCAKDFEIKGSTKIKKKKKAKG